jgi:tetratricopeptide (TPR) repeat protein
MCGRRYACRKLGRLEEAAESYGRALKQGPHSTRLLANRAYCLAKLGHFEAAIADYHAILAAEPSNVHALHNRQATRL